MTIANQILDAMRTVLPQGGEFLPLHEPVFSGNELAYTRECIETTFVSSVGKFVDQFEEMLADYTGAKRAIAVTNGTAALHMALMLAGVRPGDEVIIPGLTFVATANAVSYTGAIPHIVDSEEETLGIDVQKLDEHLGNLVEVRGGECVNSITMRRIAAIVPVHIFGMPLKVDRLLDVCKKYSIPMVEDAAEAIGTMYKGKHCGRFGTVSSLSFNGNKTITTGGGGAILTDDEELADLGKHLTTTAKAPHKWEYFHDMVGYNYRMPNINAALGCAQMEKLADILASKRALADKYSNAFKSVEGVRFLTEPEGSRSNYWFCTIILDPEVEQYRDEILAITNEAAFMTRPLWTAMHRLPMYEKCPRADMGTAESLERRVVNIPSGAGIIGV